MGVLSWKITNDEQIIQSAIYCSMRRHEHRESVRLERKQPRTCALRYAQRVRYKFPRSLATVYTSRRVSKRLKNEREKRRIVTTRVVVDNGDAGRHLLTDKPDEMQTTDAINHYYTCKRFLHLQSLLWLKAETHLIMLHRIDWNYASFKPKFGENTFVC